MKKPSSKIREEITRLQDQLRQAETREAERIGRLALKAALGEIQIEEAELLVAFAEVAARFRESGGKPFAKKPGDASKNAGGQIAPGAAPGSGSEA